LAFLTIVYPLKAGSLETKQMPKCASLRIIVFGALTSEMNYLI